MGMNILCVCRQGRVRSDDAARILREMGHRAAACSWRHKKAIEVAFHLADVIFFVDVPGEMASFVREVCEREGRAEVRVLETGVLAPEHPELEAKLKELFKQWGDL